MIQLKEVLKLEKYKREEMYMRKRMKKNIKKILKNLKMKLKKCQRKYTENQLM